MYGNERGIDSCGRTSARVLIRRPVRLGNIVVPKSVDPTRMASTFDMFDFELDNSDMSSVSSLDDRNRLGPDPQTPSISQAGE
jgi:2,5-diketo-D-gluconate reductase A